MNYIIACYDYYIFMLQMVDAIPESILYLSHYTIQNKTETTVVLFATKTLGFKMNVTFYKLY